MADKSLDILIKTQAELQGAEAAAESLERQIGKAKVLKQDYAQLDKQLQQVRGSISEYKAAQDSAGSATDTLGKKSEFLNLRHAELKKLLGELGREFPLAGAAGRAFMNPLVAGITLVIGAFALAKHHLDDWNRALDEAAARAAERDFLPGIEAAKAALEEGARHAADFAGSIAEIGKGAKTASDQLGEMIKKIHELESGNADVLASELHYKTAQINLAEKQGKISPEVADIARAKLQNDYARKQEANKQAAENASVAAQQSAFDNAPLVQRGLEVKTQSAQKAELEAKALLEKVQADRAAQDAKLKEDASKGITRSSLEEQQQKAQEKFDREFQFNKNLDTGFGVKTATGRAKEELDKSTQALEEFKKRQAIVDQASKQIPSLQVDVDQKGRAARSAEEAERRNREFIESQRTELPATRNQIYRARSFRGIVNQNEEGARGFDVQSQVIDDRKVDEERRKRDADQQLHDLQNPSSGSSQLPSANVNTKPLADAINGLTSEVLKALAAIEADAKKKTTDIATLRSRIQNSYLT